MNETTDSGNFNQPPEINHSESKPKMLRALFFSLIFILSIAAAFITGYYIHTLISSPKNNGANSSPISTQDITEKEVVDETKSPKGKEYYDDTIIAITPDNPKKILVATATRQETENGANQNTRVSFFDGSAWTRKILTKSYENTAIHTNEIILEWQITIDKSRLLKQSVTGKIRLNDNQLDFDTGIITNNISVRSLPGFTKFMSTNDGILTINGNIFPAKILYTRIYSNNSEEIQFYGSSLGLTTHWLAFWDTLGNFYHVDLTVVANPTHKYQTHQFGVMVDNLGRVSKTFEILIDTSNEMPPQKYQITLGPPINKNLFFNIGKSIDKAPNNSYNWFMSEGTGQIDGVQGYGIAEYIQHQKLE